MFPVENAEKCPISGKYCEVDNCSFHDDDLGCLVGLSFNRSWAAQKEIVKQLERIADSLHRIWAQMPGE